MSKTSTTSSANNSASTPEKVAKAAPSSVASERPLAPKARYIMVALLDGPKTRKGIVEFCTVKKWKVDPTATTSYIGSVSLETRTHWDRVALDPDTKGWNHVSLQGRGYVTYNAETKTFSLTKEGEPVAKSIAKELNVA